jgi:hypothetical protein
MSSRRVRAAAVVALASAAPRSAAPIAEAALLQTRLVVQPSWTSSWAIDDVFLDPYSRR